MTDKIVAFVLYPGLTPLDLIGPLQVMTGLEVAEGVYGIEPRHHVVVVAEHLDAVPTDTPCAWPPRRRWRSFPSLTS